MQRQGEFLKSWLQWRLLQERRIKDGRTLNQQHRARAYDGNAARLMSEWNSFKVCFVELLKIALNFEFCSRFLGKTRHAKSSNELRILRPHCQFRDSF